MAIVNGYVTLADLKATMSINDTTDDTVMEDAIEAASRQIDAYCGRGRKFWQDAGVVARKYYPTQSRRVIVDDISTLTGLLVAVDTSDDGTFDVSLTINTDFIVEPVNAAAEYPVQPWTSILLINGTLTQFLQLASGRPSVEVTAKYGWSAIPSGIARACLVQSRNIFKSQDATFGAFQLSIDGQIRSVPQMDPVARAQLEPFVRYDEVD